MDKKTLKVIGIVGTVLGIAGGVLACASDLDELQDKAEDLREYNNQLKLTQKDEED